MGGRIVRGRGIDHGARYEKPVMQMKMCDAEVVAKFRSVVGLGRVYGPYKNKTGERDGYPRQDYFVWTARSADCELVIERLWPWLSSYRRRRASEVGFAIAKHVETVAGDGRDD